MQLLADPSHLISCLLLACYLLVVHGQLTVAALPVVSVPDPVYDPDPVNVPDPANGHRILLYSFRCTLSNLKADV